MVALHEWRRKAAKGVRSAIAVARRSAGRAAGGLLREKDAQGTTEYAILVGVLVVIAIVAIVAFRDRVSELWGAISDGINGL